MGFLAELLWEALHERGISEDPAIAKGLWDVPVMGKFSSRQTVAGLFRAQWMTAASGLASGLVSRFGVKRKGTLADILFKIILMAVAVASVVTVVGAGTQLLIKTGWLWQDVLLLTFSTMSAGRLLGLVVGLATDFLKEQKTTFFKRRRLWYRACRDLGLASDAIEKTADKGMVLLLEDAQTRRDREEVGSTG